MKSRNLSIIVSLVLLFTMLMTACATPAAPTQAPAAPAETEAAQPEAAEPEAESPAGEQPYAGTTIRLVGVTHPWTEALTPLLPDFEAQTGIKVNLETYGEDQLNQKLTTEFTAGSSDIDVFMQRPLQEARLMAQNGWYTDLNTFLNDPAKTPAEYDFADFQKGAIGTETVDGALTGIPIVTEQEVLYYRKDLLEAAGLEPPKTLEELKVAAEKLTDTANGVYGFVARGQRSPAVTQFSSFLYSFGGDWFNQETGTATLNTPEALEAFQFYGDLLREYGPPGTLNMSWPQAVAIFAQGQAAMYTDASSIFPNILDPTKSEVADQTGVVVFPAGPAGSNMYSVTSWGISIPSTAPNPDAAWEFVKWATSKDITVKVQGDGAVPSARNSAWESAEGTAGFPADWVEAVQASGNGKGYDRPLVVQVGAARDIIGSVIVTAIEGGDVAAAAEQANKDFQTLLDGEKK